MGRAGNGWGSGRWGRHGVAGTAAEICVEAEAFSDVVKAKRVRKRRAIATSLRGVMSLNRHVKDPAGEQHTEDLTDVREAHEDSEDEEVSDPFGVLLVVHGTDSGDEAEKRGETGIGRPGGDPGGGRDVRGTRVDWLIGRSGGGTVQTDGETRLAIHRGTDDADGLLVEGAAAVLAEGNGSGFCGGDGLRIMCGGLHTRPPVFRE